MNIEQLIKDTRAKYEEANKPEPIELTRIRCENQFRQWLNDAIARDVQKALGVEVELSDDKVIRGKRVLYFSALFLYKGTFFYLNIEKVDGSTPYWMIDATDTTKWVDCVKRLANELKYPVDGSSIRFDKLQEALLLLLSLYE